MTAIESIYERRAVRDYRDELVPEDLIRELIDAAVQAPSAVNAQPWAFVIVQNQEILKQISIRTLALMKEREMSDGLREQINRPDWNLFYNAGTLVIICAKPGGLHPEWDCCLAGQNLMLAARERGLGSCVIGFSWIALTQPDTKDLLGIPHGYEAVLPIILGLPVEFPATHTRNAPEILRWITQSTVSVAV